MDPTLTGGTNQDAAIPAIPDSSVKPDVNKAPDSSGAPANPDDEGKSAEQLKEERKIAIQEAVKNSKEAKDAKAELSYYKESNAVAKNPDYLIKINEKDPVLAEKIAQDLWSSSYNDLLEAGTQQSNKTQPNVSELVKAALQKEREAEKQTAEEQNINKSLEDFLVKNEIIPGDPKFKTINSEFNSTTFSSASQAKRFLAGLLVEISDPDEDAPINNAPTMTGRTSVGKNDKSISTGLEALMKETGVKSDALRAFEKTKK